MIVRASNIAIAAAALVGCFEEPVKTTNGSLVAEAAATVESAAPDDETEIPLKEAKLLIEHNATGLDTGFQIFIDGEEWKV